MIDCSVCNLLLPPHHLVDDADVGLDDLHDLGGDILIHIVGDRKAVLACTLFGHMLHHPNVCKHKRQSILNWELTVTSQAINWRLFLSYTYGSSSVILTALPGLYLRFVLSYTNGLNSRLQFVWIAIYSWTGGPSTVGSKGQLWFTWKKNISSGAITLMLKGVLT